jgi:hypothetical protein
MKLELYRSEAKLLLALLESKAREAEDADTGLSNYWGRELMALYHKIRAQMAKEAE